MCALAIFLRQLLYEGKVLLKNQPVRLTGPPPTEAVELLETAFGDYRLNVAGPLIEFHPAAALAAAEVVRQACWYLLNRAEQESALAKSLTFPGPPAMPAEHLSADLVLRFLPQIHRRAAYIYGVLLRDYHLAAHTLLQGGLAHDAAIIYLTKVGDCLAAARAFEAAGEIDRAVQLYRRQGEHVQAGDLLRRAGEEGAALVEYRLAAEKLADSRQEYHTAGELLLTKTGRVDLALLYFQAGWARRQGANVLPGVFSCGLRLAELYAQEEEPRQLLMLTAEADDWFRSPGKENEAGQFYNRLAQLADRKNLASVRDELRDRALMGIAAKLRQRAAVEERPGHLVAAMLGRSGPWKCGLFMARGRIGLPTF
jgi:hypothetical protein